MSLLHDVLSAFTGLFFLYYGAACLFSKAMKAEFERFGIPRLRLLVGVLDLLGGIGLWVGLIVPGLGVLAAVGISLLMSIVVVQRIQQGDTLSQMAQAGFFALVALWLSVFGYLQL